ncbi:MAG: hypothetical protein M1833_007125 [Piccolia ochrophora]|nr:MAG: hypothetical protein M1833_007125 [Piccolia ochrophora]
MDPTPLILAELRAVQAGFHQDASTHTFPPPPSTNPSPPPSYTSLHPPPPPPPAPSTTTTTTTATPNVAFRDNLPANSSDRRRSTPPDQPVVHITISHPLKIIGHNNFISAESLSSVSPATLAEAVRSALAGRDADGQPTVHVRVEAGVTVCGSRNVVGRGMPPLVKPVGPGAGVGVGAGAGVKRRAEEAADNEGTKTKAAKVDEGE